MDVDWPTRKSKEQNALDNDLNQAEVNSPVETSGEAVKRSNFYNHHRQRLPNLEIHVK
jgi:hypothetical protein